VLVLVMSAPFWARKTRKKTIIQDFKTGKEYTLSSPRYGLKNRQECHGGCHLSGIPRLHDSGEEAAYCNKLRILKKVKEIKDYQAQVTFGLRNAQGDHVGSVRVDFLVTLKGGKKEVHEYKGEFFGTLREFQFGRALFTWNYPETEYKTLGAKDLL
jgi:hypothetical protein